MSQISLPLRIVLVGAVAVLAAWMLVLKPSPGQEAPPPTPDSMRAAVADDPNASPANTGLGRAVQKARGAAGTSDAANARAGSETSPSKTAAGAAAKPQTHSSSSSKPAPGTAAKPADPALAELPSWLRQSLDKKVVAILFWNRNAADDRRTHAAFKKVYRADGDVVTRSVPIARIARYGAVARGVDVQQTPTVMVIDRDREATPLVGYSNLKAINQAIIDGLLATNGPVSQVAYLRKLRGTCSRVRDRLFTGSAPESSKAFAVWADGAGVRVDRWQAKVGRLTPPAAYRSLDRRLRNVLAADKRLVGSLKGAGGLPLGAYRSAAAKDAKLWAPLSLDLAAAGLDECR